MMIKGLLETHLHVENIDRSIEFYANVIGLEQCHCEKERNLTFRNFLRDGTERPMVFAWTPAISIYFDDPDGHSLEFIGLLDGKSRPEKGIVSYEEWLKIENN